MKRVAGSTLYRRRKLINVLSQAGSIAAAGIGLGALVLIVWTLLYNGIRSIDLAMFTEMTPPPGSAGGMLNAIVGSLILTLVGVAFATPIAILAGTYLAEYGRDGWLASVTRFLNDVLLSAPSIIIGLFVYSLYVAKVGHFSGWAGACALALIVVPVVVRTTDDMLRLVPNSLREAAVALGCPSWRMVLSVSYRAARSGILTGVLLAVARISGETAPLLFTALNNQFWSLNFNAPMSNLPVVIFQFAMSPYDDWHRLAWGGAALITLAVLALNILARLLFRKTY
jgi:phosphate transport system permease protein